MRGCRRTAPEAVPDGPPDEPAQPEDRGDVPVAAAAVIDPAQGSVFVQALGLGAIQIVLSVAVNAAIAVSAGSIALFLTQRPSFALVQRWILGTVLAGLAVRMMTEARR